MNRFSICFTVIYISTQSTFFLWHTGNLWMFMFVLGTEILRTRQPTRFWNQTKSTCNPDQLVKITKRGSSEAAAPCALCAPSAAARHHHPPFAMEASAPETRLNPSFSFNESFPSVLALQKALLKQLQEKQPSQAVPDNQSPGWATTPLNPIQADNCC